MGDWFWNINNVKDSLTKPAKRYKYFITDDKDEFLARLEVINNRALANQHDNLKYLEELDNIRRVREGEDIFKVFPWIRTEK
jgi:hypothetical protein